MCGRCLEQLLSAAHIYFPSTQINVAEMALPPNARKARDAFVMAHADSDALSKRNAELAKRVDAELGEYQGQVEEIMRRNGATAVPISTPILDDKGKPTDQQTTVYVRIQKRPVPPSYTGAALASVLAAPQDKDEGSRVQELLGNAVAVLESHEERMGKEEAKKKVFKEKVASRASRARKRQASEEEKEERKAKRAAVARAKQATERAAEAQAQRFEAILQPRR